MSSWFSPPRPPWPAVKTACELAWADGFRTGLVLGLGIGVVVAIIYLLGRERR